MSARRIQAKVVIFSSLYKTQCMVIVNNILSSQDDLVGGAVA